MWSGVRGCGATPPRDGHADRHGRCVCGDPHGSRAGFFDMLIQAGAEAGMVGGLADWFAVTALFRHPLGVPIPHTAIIPNNKDRIGRTLAALSQTTSSHPRCCFENCESLRSAAGSPIGWQRRRLPG